MNYQVNLGAGEKLVVLIRSAVREEFHALWHAERAERLQVAQPERAEWLTTEQAAALLQICPTSLEKARSLGRGPLAEIPYAKIGRSVRYARADILAAVARLRVPGRAPKI